MRLLFWRSHSSEKKKEPDLKEFEATKIHKQNITKIVKSREKAVTLNRVLKQNNITIELAKAIGH